MQNKWLCRPIRTGLAHDLPFIHLFVDVVDKYEYVIHPRQYIWISRSMIKFGARTRVYF